MYLLAPFTLSCIYFRVEAADRCLNLGTELVETSDKMKTLQGNVRHARDIPLTFHRR